MRLQLWQYALLRPGTLFPVGLGLWASLGRAWIGLGAALIAYGLFQAFKLVNETPDAEDRLFLRREKNVAAFAVISTLWSKLVCFNCFLTLGDLRNWAVTPN